MKNHFTLVGTPTQSSMNVTHGKVSLDSTVYDVLIEYDPYDDEVITTITHDKKEVTHFNDKEIDEIEHLVIVNVW